MTCVDVIRRALKEAGSLSSAEMANAHSWGADEKKLASITICKMRDRGELITTMDERVARHSLVAGYEPGRAGPAKPATTKAPPQMAKKPTKPALAEMRKQFPKMAIHIVEDADSPTSSHQLPQANLSVVARIDPTADAASVPPAAPAPRAVTKQAAAKPLASKTKERSLELRCRQLADDYEALMGDAIDAMWPHNRLRLLHTVSSLLRAVA